MTRELKKGEIKHMINLVANTLVIGSKLERKYGKMGTVVGVLLIAVIFMAWLLVMAYVTQVSFSALEKVINHFWF